MKSDAAYLNLMLDAFRKIRDFREGIGHGAFLLDEKTQSATILQLMLIGELAKRLSDRTRGEIDLPWRRIMGMRDWVAHDYFNLEIEQIWQTAIQEAPDAEAKIKNALETVVA